MKIAISFSGGRTSAFMTKFLLNYYQSKWDDLKKCHIGYDFKKNKQIELKVIFANTGKEREETLEFINLCDIKFNLHTVWVESIFNMEYGHGVDCKIVDYKTASRNGEPFEKMIQKHGMPNVQAPFCSRELKAYPIKKYLKNIGWKKYYTAIGIRADEFDRNSANREKERIFYPLIELKSIKKSDVNEFWSKQDFDLDLKSYEGNCDLCYKKSFRKLMTIAKENPHLLKWWQEMENKYENFIPSFRKNNENIKLPFRFFRKKLSVLDLLEASKNNFRLAIDDSKITINQLGLFDELDQTDGCEESCEAF